MYVYNKDGEVEVKKNYSLVRILRKNEYFGDIVYHLTLQEQLMWYQN